MVRGGEVELGWTLEAERCVGGQQRQRGFGVPRPWDKGCDRRYFDNLESLTKSTQHRALTRLTFRIRAKPEKSKGAAGSGPGSALAAAGSMAKRAIASFALFPWFPGTNPFSHLFCHCQ